jgi:acyl-coenzyme A thioesterase PaaI-like protein
MPQSDPWISEFESNPDLIRLQPHESGKSWVHHNPGRKRLDITYFYSPVEKRLFGTVYFGPEAEGPPGCGHGGSIASILDDSMGTSAWASGFRVVALNLNVNFRKFVPLETYARIETWVDRVDGRKVYTKGRLLDINGEPHAEAEGLFLQIDFGKLLDKQPKGPVA